MSTETEVQTTEPEVIQEESTEPLYDFDSMSDDEVKNFHFPEDEQEEVPADEPETETVTESEEVSTEATEPEEEDSNTANTEEADEEVPSSGIVGKVVRVGGVDITIGSEEEALTLIQRGLGANKRNQELAPKLKFISMLEKHGLLETDKLNQLIDISKGDTTALKKLISDKGVDTFDLSIDGESVDYTPNDHSVSDSEIAVSEAFDSIKSEEKYDETVSTISDFNSDAKQILTDTPSLIPELHAHIADGTYSEAMQIVAVERAKGNMNGLGDFQAYRHVLQVVRENSASNRGTGEAGHNGKANGQADVGNLAGTEGTQEAGHKQKADSSRNSLNAARQAAQSTTTVRGVDNSPTVIDFDSMTDDQIKNFDYSQL